MYLRFKFRVISLPPAPLKENSNTHICLFICSLWLAISGMCHLPLPPLCVSSVSAAFPVSRLVVMTTVTKASGGYRRKETWTTDLDATIFNSSAQHTTKAKCRGNKDSFLGGKYVEMKTKTCCQILLLHCPQLFMWQTIHHNNCSWYFSLLMFQ